MPSEKTMAFLRAKFKTKDTREEQYKDLVETIREKLGGYYRQWKLPIKISPFLTTQIRTKAPLYKFTEAREMLISDNVIRVILDIDNHQYIMPGDIPMTESDISELSWELFNTRRRMAGN